MNNQELKSLDFWQQQEDENKQLMSNLYSCLTKKQKEKIINRCLEVWNEKVVDDSFTHPTEIILNDNDTVTIYFARFDEDLDGYLTGHCLMKNRDAEEINNRVNSIFFNRTSEIEWSTINDLMEYINFVNDWQFVNDTFDEMKENGQIEITRLNIEELERRHKERGRSL